MSRKRKIKDHEEYFVEEIKPESGKVEYAAIEFDVIGDEAIETIENVSQHEEIIVESTEIKGDAHDASGLNSYCCQEYFDGFEALFQHMEEYHVGTLRKSLGTRKQFVVKCVEEYESIEYLDESDEFWVEETLEPEETTTMEVESPVNVQETPVQVVDSGKILCVLENIQAPRKQVKTKESPKDETQYECHTCNRMCVGFQEWQNHQKRHDAPLRCDICHEDFFSRTLLNQHIFKHKVEELGNSNFNCTYCQMVFESSDEVDAHRLEFHTRSEVPFACESCDKSFSIKFDLMKHIQNIHKEKRKLNCKYCYKKCPDEETLEFHLLEHENERASTCPHCNKSFKGIKLLRHHITYYHSRNGYAEANKKRNLHCSICDKAFIYPNQVRNHEINIHGVGEAAFFCNVCQKGFAKQWDLQNHELMHSNNKPFKCSECFKDFRRATHLKSHIYNVHTPATEKPEIRCLLCDKPFKNVEALRKHIRKIHEMTMNEMYKRLGIPYNGRDIPSAKVKSATKFPEMMKLEEEGTVEIEVLETVI